MTDRPVGSLNPGLQRIGILLAHFNDSFQRELWKAVRTRARDWNVSTVAFLGHGLEEPELRHRTSTALYQLARGPLLDGLVVFSHNVGTHTGPEAVSQLVTELGLPAVSLGYDLPGVPTVRAVSDEAIGQLVDHLVQVHGRSRFALVTGPTRQTESADRERAVRQRLAALGLPPKPSPGEGRPVQPRAGHRGRGIPFLPRNSH